MLTVHVHLSLSIMIALLKHSLVQDGQPLRPGYAPAISECFGPQDFRIGTTVTMYGRQFLIHDCDAFTRTWLQVPLRLPCPL